MHDQECNEQLYRETGRTINSQERENCGAVARHGIIISTTSTGNRVAIDMFATTATCLKTDRNGTLQLRESPQSIICLKD